MPGAQSVGPALPQAVWGEQEEIVPSRACCTTWTALVGRKAPSRASPSHADLSRSRNAPLYLHVASDIRLSLSSPSLSLEK